LANGLQQTVALLAFLENHERLFDETCKQVNDFGFPHPQPLTV